MLEMDSRLVFLIGAPRSGTTLLERMLGSHSRILGGPERHLLTPLAHLGYFGRVEAAPYDPVIAEAGIHDVVSRLLGGEDDYVDACRAYADRIYRSLIDASPDKSMLLDKTPAYALVLPFVTRLYPNARYVVLTRQPFAIFASQANSFFDGDFEVAWRQSPVLDRFVPAIGRFLRERPVPLVHLRYEDFVADPEPSLREVIEFCGLEWEPGVLAYGPEARSSALGDPTGVAAHSAPVTDSVDRWASEVACDARCRRLCESILAGLDPADLEAWGYPAASIRAALDAAAETAENARAPQRRPLSRYRLQRKLLVALRRRIGGSTESPLGRQIARVRRLCDVLLR